MSHFEKNDKNSATLLASGDEKMFRKLFDRLYVGLLKFAVSYAGDIHTAENIVQDAFVLLWEKRKKLNAESDPHAFLVKTVKLKLWNHNDKQRRRMIIEKGLYDNTVREFDLNMYTLDSVNTSSLYISEMERIIEDTLQTLPLKTQTVFKLSREKNFSNKEIAKKINISEKGVEYHIGKTIKILRKKLADYLGMFLLIF